MKNENSEQKPLGQCRARLRILATTDLHASLYPYDYYMSCLDESVGLIRTASLIKKFRRGAKNTILLDGGDFLNGSALSDFVAQVPSENPVVAVMNAIGYDVATVGNHEFNYGLKPLQNALEQCNFPIVSSNIRPVSPDLPVLETLILDREIIDEGGQARPLKIGFVGFAPPQLLQWDNRHLAGKIKVADIVACARQIVPKVIKAGADIVIALSHSGIAASSTETGLENASLQLAQVDGINAIIAGHQHRVFPDEQFSGLDLVDVENGTLNGVPTVMAGFCGSHLGVIDLELARIKGRWQVAGHTVNAHPIYQRMADQNVRPLVANEYQATSAARAGHLGALRHSERIVGEIGTDLHSYFSHVGYDLSLRFVMEAQTSHITALAAAGPYQDLPVLAASAAFRCGGFGGPGFYTMIKAGPVSLRNVFDLFSFPDEFCALKITGAIAKDWLERSAGIFNRIERGVENQELVNPGFPSYYSDAILGLTYMIDPSQPTRFDPEGNLVSTNHHRIVGLEYKGIPVRDDQEFLIAANDFRAFGGGNFPQITQDRIVIESGLQIRDILIRHINAGVGRDIPKTLNWRFVPLKDTSVVFESGPNAAAYLKDVPELEIEQVSHSKTGFQKFKLRLG